MEHISLYRKWRPQSFADVIGQQHVTETLANALGCGRIAHAYLFSGPRGTGKTSTARILAKAVNCVEGPTATPCNNCEACNSISDGTALDVIEIDAASNRKIDEIRDLLEKVPYSPASMRSKVYIVDEVHQLTSEASSALLKTLEEPPAHVMFVLATTEPHKLLPTIISRCQRFDFALVPTQEMSILLEHIAGREGIEIDGEAVAMIAEQAHGSVRDAIGVMDQISSLAVERVTPLKVAELLGEVETDLVFEMVDRLAERDAAYALALVDRIVEGGKDPHRFVESLIAHLRHIFLLQNAANPSEIVEATQDHYERIAEQANRLKRYEIVRLIERLGETYREMRWSEHPRLLLECSLVKSTALDADVTLEGLEFRIDQLERKLEALDGERPAAAGEKPGRAAAGAGRRAAGATARKAGKEPAGEAGPEADETEAVPGVTGIEHAGEGEIEKKEPGDGGARRAVVGGDDRKAWRAVVAELKKAGQMRLYALLTKASVVGVEGGVVTVEFPPDASFQRGVLAESGEVSKIEELWKKMTGDDVKISVAGEPPAESPGTSGTAGGKKKTPPAAKETAPKKGGRREPGKSAENPPEAVKQDTGAGEEAGSGKDAKEVARLIQQRFDGEILEEE